MLGDHELDQRVAFDAALLGPAGIDRRNPDDGQGIPVGKAREAVDGNGGSRDGWSEVGADDVAAAFKFRHGQVGRGLGRVWGRFGLAPLRFDLSVLLNTHEIDDLAGDAVREWLLVAFDENLHQQEQAKRDGYAGRGCEQVSLEHEGVLVVVQW